MRILLVSDETGSPENTGFRLRLANTARGLAGIATLEWLILPRDPSTTPLVPPDVACLLHESPLILRSRARSIRRYVTGSDPWRIARIDPASTMAHLDLPSCRYDVIWFAHLDLYRSLGPALQSRTDVVVVDLDNLESMRMEHERALATSLAGLPRALRLRLDGGRWRRAEQRSADTANLAYVCSDIDRVRLGRRVRVFANGANEPDATYQPNPDPAPILLFVGSLSYDPNADAVEYFADLVLPRIRAQVPDATFRVVGRNAPERIRRLAARPGIEVIGEVASISPQLAEAALTVVPIRYGGGTRIKILDAFAHSIPVVTTAVGCEGIEAVHGEHVLVADTTEHFADACVALLTDAARRTYLAQNGRSLFERTYGWARIREGMASDVLSAMGAARAG